jgi:hypothetical protein
MEYKNENLKEANDSIIKLFHKANYLQNKNKRNFEQKKEINEIFSKKFNNMKKYEKEIEKMDISKNNSAIKFNQSFSIFNHIVKKYKERDGILYTKDLLKKDVLLETPIVSNKENKMKKYYIYNYDKYVKKTNLNNSEIIKTKRNYEEKKESNILFSKRLNNMKKYEKEIEKMDISKSNSAIKFNQSFSIFNNIVKKYKERDGILYKQDLFKKDVFQETPIVSNEQDNIKKFYIYNYNKYVKKSNLNNDNNKSKQKIKKKSKKKTKNQNEIKKINFDNLTLTNFYKKLTYTIKDGQSPL